ncbi:mRNA export factor GLE1, partial [Parasteatoda tepidariorum]|uniref:mRNA export factor GLE1 n=1 Tax=Parasteatoda tepidariorum TaxID=114398 RepID=UPI0039BCDEE1
MGDVALALRNSSKGQLKYDRFWVEEGRTKEVLDGISKYSTKISVSISPGIFPAIISENATQVSKVKTEVPSSNSKQDSTKEKPKPIHSMTDVHFFELQSEMEQPIQEYEEERQRYIQSIFENKKSEFENHILDVEKQIRQEYNLAKRKNELDARRRTGELQKLEESMMREAHEVGRLQKEQHQSHVKKLSAKILEAELKQKQAEEDLKRRLKEQEEFKAQLNTCLSEAKSFVNKSVEKLTLCEHQEHLSVPLDER